MIKGIVWLRNDLRISDHPALSRALQECDEVLFAYVFDDRVWKPKIGVSRIASFRARFLLESLANLQKQIRDRGGKIEFFQGGTVEQISNLINEFGAFRCYSQREDAWEETQDEKQIAEKCELILTGGKGLFENNDLPFDLKKLPGVFSSFRRKVEKNLSIRPLMKGPDLLPCTWDECHALPTLKDLGVDEVSSDVRQVLSFHGGEIAGHQWMKEWIWERDCLKIYKETRNGMVGSDYSSKLSPWLSAGCLSAVQVYWEIKKYEEERVANESTYWLFFELLWREFFRFVSRLNGPKLFWRSGIKEADGTRPKGDPKTLQRWKEGRTANDFVNANMIELAKTGWMSNRGRQNVASYMIHDLGQDWLAGAKHFEELLIDYDPCSNYGNWMYLAGVGNDPRPNRAFNLEKQAEYYDNDHKFRNLWNC
ncbi:MAG: DASH family cryptochrome [Verrucomicrobiota bacterium]|nr:DASH family cryptochrome [Verrucomicrobiota bacterium]